jgi:HK97 family phage prohead protease
MKNNREYRNMRMEIRSKEGAEPTYKVEGYASTFQPYVLFEEDGVKYSEQIDPTAFDEADLTDVVFRVDHEGAVYARTSAGTVELDIDEHGLHNITDLSRTANARGLFEDIAAGNYPQMSFAFVVADDEYDKDTHTRIIHRIGKVFDISAVSFPANPTTELSVSTRDYFNGVIEAEKRERAERLAAEERQKQIDRILSLMED